MATFPIYNLTFEHFEKFRNVCSVREVVMITQRYKLVTYKAHPARHTINRVSRKVHKYMRKIGVRKILSHKEGITRTMVINMPEYYDLFWFEGMLYVGFIKFQLLPLSGMPLEININK